MNETEIHIKVINKKGVHARAAAKFVRTVGLFDVQVMVAKTAGAGVSVGGEVVEVSGSSILGLMMLGAECSSTLRLRAKGAQAEEAAVAIRKLIEDKFGEE